RARAKKAGGLPRRRRPPPAHRPADCRGPRPVRVGAARVERRAARSGEGARRRLRRRHESQARATHALAAMIHGPFFERMDAYASNDTPRRMAAEATVVRDAGSGAAIAAVVCGRAGASAVPGTAGWMSVRVMVAGAELAEHDGRRL